MTKAKIKKILIIFMLLVMAVSFSACGQISAGIITYADGSVEEQVFVSLDINAVLEAGEDLALLKSKIQTDAINQANLFIADHNNKIDVHISTGVTEDTKTILEEYRKGMTYEEYNWVTEGSTLTYGIGLKFKNIDVYNYYYENDPEAKTQMHEEEHFFYNKVYWYGGTSYLKHRKLYTALKNIYKLDYPNLVFHEDAKLLYTYETDMRRLHSDADYITSIGNGNYYHTWIIEEGKEAEPIMFYYNVANGSNWIIVCLLTTLIITILLSLGVIIFDLRKNKKIKNNFKNY